MSKNKTYSNIQDEDDHVDGHPYDPSNTSSLCRENADNTIYNEPFVDPSLCSKVPGSATSPRGDLIRMSSPISPSSDIARSVTMPNNMSKFRKAAQTAIHARRMSSKLVVAFSENGSAPFCITYAQQRNSSTQPYSTTNRKMEKGAME